MKNCLSFRFLDKEILESKRLIKKYRELYMKLLKKNDPLSHKREVVLKIMTDLVGEYKYFNYNAIIFFTGSYARGIIKEESDFDLNTIYIRGNGKKYKKYEELFYYIVSSVFKLNRKMVHPVFITYNNKNNSKYVSDSMDKKDFDINLTSDSFHIKYKIRGNSKKRIYLQYLNDKNYKKVFNNLQDSELREYLFTIKFLNTNGKLKLHYDFIKNEKWLGGDLSVKLKELKLYILKSLNQKININNKIKIKDIKQYYQQEALQMIYNYILYKKILNNNCVNMADLYNQNIFEMSFLLDYVQTISELQKIFVTNKLEYSIHSPKIMKLYQFKEIEPYLKKLDNKLDIAKKNILKELI